MTPFPDQSALITWQNPNGITDEFEIIVRWGEIVVQDFFPHIIERSAHNLTVSAVSIYSNP